MVFGSPSPRNGSEVCCVFLTGAGSILPGLGSSYGAGPFSPHRMPMRPLLPAGRWATCGAFRTRRGVLVPQGRTGCSGARVAFAYKRFHTGALGDPPGVLGRGVVRSHVSHYVLKPS